MSYSESQHCLDQAKTALTCGQYRQAVSQYAAVVVGLAPAASSSRPLTPQAVPLVRHYAAASRGQSVALTQLGETSPAESTLLAALARLRGCLSNLSTPVANRAPLLTEYKLCFYALAELYFSNNQSKKLAGYVRRHTSELSRWASELHLVRATLPSN